LYHSKEAVVDVLEMYDNNYATLKMCDKMVLIGLLERALL
jgi:translation initiation factor 2 beta subunit (eIF-2beta)/eIF-5